MNDQAIQLYIELLEKTNQQLSLWSNPYGVLVAILSFLVAFLAIAAAVILYRQTQEYKDLYTLALKQYENTLQDNLKKIGIDAESKIESFIQTKTKEIEELSGDTQKQAKKIINDLKKEKESIGSRIQFSSIGDNQPFLSKTFDHFKLTSELGLDSNDNSNGFVVVGSNYCSQCGHMSNSNSLSINNYCSNCGNKL